MRRSGLLLVETRPTYVGQTTQGRTGSGHELAQDCAFYFDFLGQTGAGRAETFDQNLFGTGYCAGLMRGVSGSASSLRSDVVCLPDDVTATRAVWTVV